MNLKKSLELFEKPTEQMTVEIAYISRIFEYWTNKGFSVGWLDSNAVVLRWYASFVAAGRPKGRGGFLRGLRISLKASLLRIVPLTTRTVVKIENSIGLVSSGKPTSKGNALTFDLDSGRKTVRKLNDFARINGSLFRYKLGGNEKIRRRGLRYLMRYEIEIPPSIEFVSMDSFDGGTDGFDEWNFSDHDDDPFN